MTAIVIGNCVFCGKRWSVDVDAAAYDAYARGAMLAQEAFPKLSATKRECLISGICPHCQDKIFG